MILALILGARKLDPLEYDEGIDKFRGICEAFVVLCFMYNFYVQGCQFKRYIQ